MTHNHQSAYEQFQGATPSLTKARQLKIGDIIAAYYADQLVPRLEVVIDTPVCPGDTATDLRTIPLSTFGTKLTAYSRAGLYSSFNTDRWEVIGNILEDLPRCLESLKSGAYV